ncbi:MAG: glycosyl hydrolase family 18 protein, partial [Sphingobacterium sp.]
YPTSAEANISASENDYDNFTLLMQEIRNQISTNKLLTLASIADAQFIDFKAIEPLVDFVNIMMYDVGKPPYHHASLYRSPLSGRVTCVEALQEHLDAGMPKNKLVLGLPFYGRGDKKAVPDFVLFKDLGTLSGFTEKWDDQAKVPYLVDAQGQYVLTYENQRSLALKCEFIKQSGILGAMYWEFAGDNQEQELSYLLYNGLNGAPQ